MVFMSNQLIQIRTQTELLLDRLVLTCSAIILRHVNITNVCSLLSDAMFYHATHLVERLQQYAAINLECLLESRLFDDTAPDLIKRLSIFVRSEQAKKLPVSRSNRLVDEATTKNIEWLKLQDIPQPIVRSSKAILAIRYSPRLSPVAPTIGKPNARRSPPTAPVTPPPSKAIDRLGDEIFAMDDEQIPALSLDSPRAHKISREEHTQGASSLAWKGKTSSKYVSDLSLNTPSTK